MNNAARRDSHPMATESTIRILSLGAGVQSTTLLLMVIQGELEPVDAAIFADTGWEPQAVYAHLAWLESQAQAAGIPIYWVSAGNLREDLLREVDPATSSGKTGHIGQPPFWVRNAARTMQVETLWGVETVTVAETKAGRLWRKCTQEYKLRPIRRKTRELMVVAGAWRVEQWLGISWDEVQRMKDSGVQYITNRYPLVERRMTRQDCLGWLQAHGYPEPPKSACLGCPFHDDAYWAHLRETSPAEWADTVEVDRRIRHGLPGVYGELYMHRSCQPLDQVQFQLKPMDPMGTSQGVWDGWGAECEGICGV